MARVARRPEGVANIAGRLGGVANIDMGPDDMTNISWRMWSVCRGHCRW